MQSCMTEHWISCETGLWLFPCGQIFCGSQEQEVINNICRLCQILLHGSSSDTCLHGHRLKLRGELKVWVPVIFLGPTWGLELDFEMKLSQYLCSLSTERLVLPVVLLVSQCLCYVNDPRSPAWEFVSHAADSCGSKNRCLLLVSLKL